MRQQPTNGTVLICAAAAIMLVLGGGCARKVTRFDVLDFRGSGDPQRYVQTFDECYYCIDAHNNVDIVARYTSHDADGLPTTQAIHIRTFWVPQPGRTFAERTMINATVSYIIVSGFTGATFEGSGFLSFRENRKKDQITGQLELSSLTPQRRLGQAERLFHRAELSGTLVARRDKARVLATLHEMQRLFGPMPHYDLSSGTVDLP